jgi:3-hydroxyisobutyrate dehydrogenase
MILRAYGVDIEVFKKIASNLWFGQVLERYLDRILNERTPRFRAELAMKDYTYISQTLRDAGLPSLVSDALANFYAIASRGGYADKDYPYAARFFIDLASKGSARSSKAASI